MFLSNDKLFMFWLVVLLPVFYVIPRGRTQYYTQCNHIYDSSFDECPKLSREHDYSYPNRVEKSTTSNKNNNNTLKCTAHGAPCNDVINVTMIPDQSSSDRVLTMISEMLRHCCGGCGGRFLLTNLSHDLAHIDMTTVDSADVIYPVIGRFSMQWMYELHFLPVFDAPSAYLLTLEKTEREMVLQMITGCLDMWPLLVICVLWAIIAGFVIWFFEKRENVDEFPPSFVYGVIEGTWWAFVSMTTLGYGDRIPRSALGRVFSVMWVMTGITITSIYIASLANMVFAIATPENPVLNGKQVGGLKHQLQDAAIISQHGGVLKDISAKDKIAGVGELLWQLKTGVTSGFVVSEDVYHHFVQEVFQGSGGGTKYRNYSELFGTLKLVRTVLDFKREKLVTGMLLKSRDHYDYFRTYFENNWSQIQSCNLFSSTLKDRDFEEAAGPSHFEGLFYPFFHGTLVTLAVIAVFGCVYEVWRYRYEGRDNNKSSRSPPPSSITTIPHIIEENGEMGEKRTKDIY